LICLECGQLQEIDDKLIEDLKIQLLKDKAFQVADKPMKIYGCSSRYKKQLKD
jgi:Fe2+ or Zn2+ uptake regulation protein